MNIYKAITILNNNKDLKKVLLVDGAISINVFNDYDKYEMVVRLQKIHNISKTDAVQMVATHFKVVPMTVWRAVKRFQ